MRPAVECRTPGVQRRRRFCLVQLGLSCVDQIADGLFRDDARMARRAGAEMLVDRLAIVVRQLAGRYTA